MCDESPKNRGRDGGNIKCSSPIRVLRLLSYLCCTHVFDDVLSVLFHNNAMCGLAKEYLEIGAWVISSNIH